MWTKREGERQRADMKQSGGEDRSGENKEAGLGQERPEGRGRKEGRGKQEARKRKPLVVGQTEAGRGKEAASGEAGRTEGTVSGRNKMA